MNSNWSYSPKTLNLGQNWQFFVLCDLEIWLMTFKNNRAPLICCFKLRASFCTHSWIQIAVTVWKRPIWVKFDDFYSRVTLKFDGWPSKTIGHLFFALSSFVHHFVAIGEFKLELQSGDIIWVKIDDFFRPCDLLIWPMTFKNNRAPLLCYFKHCVSFRSHWWMQTAVTVRKRPTWVKFDNF